MWYHVWYLIVSFPDLCHLSYVEEGEKAGCHAIIVLQMYCFCKCSVAFPRGAMGWSAVSDCGIS